MKASSLTWFLLSLFSVCIIMSTVSQKTCWDEKYTSASCHKLFCPPWLRCVDGKCICKLPYQCPRNKTFGVCTQANRQFLSYCQLKSAECTNPLYRFSSVSPCTDAFQMSLRNKEGKPVTKKGIVKIKLPNHQNESFVCTEKWTITEANVACRQLDFPQGASHEKFQYGILEVDQKQPDCLDVSCKGSETTLAECTLKKGKGGKNRAGVTCYKETKECADNQFTCVNGKCILSEMTCNGENDCGDLSDELCCTECKQGFHCKSDICIPESYVCNGELDCIRGEDELNCKGEELEKPTVTPAGRSEKSENNDGMGDELQKLTVTSAAGSENSEKNDVGTNAVNYSIDAERKRLREIIPSLNCGVPVENTAPKRVKRIIGGQNAEKNQFPWQVAIKDGTKVNCGGIYIGGCWVLSAAHCVRADQPQKYRIIVELLDRLSYDQDIDSFPVKSVKVHEFYNPSTYENDIALLEVVNIYNKPTCMQVENNLVPACVPWSPHQFKAGETCTVSGWGRAEGLSKVFHLKWGHIKLMNNCSSVYKERFLDKMECAGTYDGSIDACKGDSGGPLICYDANKVGYVWGIVSWGENCGVAGYPGVYTKVAQYFEWISRHVGRQLISKYNI